MRGKEQFRQTKRINYRCSLIAMVMTQALIFSFEMSVLANIVAYIINLIVWVMIGAVLEAVVATHHGIELSKKEKGVH